MEHICSLQQYLDKKHLNTIEACEHDYMHFAGKTLECATGYAACLPIFRKLRSI